MSIWQDLRRDLQRIKGSGPLVTGQRVLAFVMLIVVLCALKMLPMAFPLFNIKPRACCSCICEKRGGDLCAGTKRSSYWTADCDRICRAACGKKGCRVKKTKALPKAQCGKVRPFL